MNGRSYQRGPGGGAPWRGYYLTAYGLAVKNGFQGSEREWLDSLKGEQGDPGKDLVIKGSFDSESALREEHPRGTEGDYYFVGTGEEYQIFFWDPTEKDGSGDWKGFELRGPRGETGERGPMGPQGIRGERGEKGLTGSEGPTGPRGAPGPQGERGPKGDAGDPGPEGPQGKQGDVWVPSVDGETGELSWEKNAGTPPESVNIRGPQGNMGPVGPEGPRGETGAEGPEGPKGDTGDVWVPQYDGESGDLSWTKNAGDDPQPVNIRGPQGETGKTGDAGPVGPKGDAGDVWVPSVDGETGELSWEKNAGTPPQTVNIRGPQGEPGPQGERGPVGPAGPGSGDMVASTYDPQGKAEDIYTYADNAAKNAVKDVSAGNVKFEDGETFQQKLEAGELKGDRGETGPAGPAGEAGKDGAPGEQGAPGEPGTPGKDGAAGKDGATWRPSVDADSGLLTWTQDSSGEAPESVNIKGPKGDKGEPGANGSDGAPGKNGENGAPGKDGAAAGFGEPTAEVDDSTGTPTVEVTASGEDTEKVFHFKFTGLKGETGPAGAVGPAGPAGAAGEAGKDGSPGATGPQGPEGPNKVSTTTAADISGLLKGEGGKVAQATAGTDYMAPPKVLTVQLTASGGTTQTVDAAGVLADETAQEIHIMPKASDMKAYMDAGAYCSGQAAGTLTFTMDTAPSQDITVYVTIWAVK